MTGKEVIEAKVAKRLRENPEEAESIGVRVAVELTGDGGGRWILDCTKNPAEVKEDTNTKAETTIVMSADSLVNISEGKLNAVSAFMFGKIKVQGDVGTAIKLGKVLT